MGRTNERRKRGEKKKGKENVIKGDLKQKEQEYEKGKEEEERRGKEK